MVDLGQSRGGEGARGLLSPNESIGRGKLLSWPHAIDKNSMLEGLTSVRWPAPLRGRGEFYRLYQTRGSWTTWYTRWLPLWVLYVILVYTCGSKQCESRICACVYIHIYMCFLVTHAVFFLLRRVNPFCRGYIIYLDRQEKEKKRGREYQSGNIMAIKIAYHKNLIFNSACYSSKIIFKEFCNI